MFDTASASVQISQRVLSILQNAARIRMPNSRSAEISLLFAEAQSTTVGQSTPPQTEGNFLRKLKSKTSLRSLHGKASAPRDAGSSSNSTGTFYTISAAPPSVPPYFGSPPRDYGGSGYDDQIMTNATRTWRSSISFSHAPESLTPSNATRRTEDASNYTHLPSGEERINPWRQSAMEQNMAMARKEAGEN